jgi:hypothetical protein
MIWKIFLFSSQFRKLIYESYSHLHFRIFIPFKVFLIFFGKG